MSEFLDVVTFILAFLLGMLAGMDIVRREMIRKSIKKLKEMSNK